MTIELRIKETTVKSEAVKLQKILNVADYEKSKNLSEILSSFSDRSERSAGAEQNSPKAQSEDISFDKNEIKSEANQTQIRESKIETERPTAREIKAENRNQDRGR
jgi:gas vesicle protein